MNFNIENKSKTIIIIIIIILALWLPRIHAAGRRRTMTVACFSSPTSLILRHRSTTASFLFSRRPHHRGRRQLSTLVAASQPEQQQQQQQQQDQDAPPPLYDPSQFYSNNTKIPYPKSLSPSSVLEFQKCPQSYLFQYLYNLKQPPSLVLLKGILCHEALQQIFDLEPPSERSIENLQNLFRRSWSRRKNNDNEKYRELFLTANNDDDDDNKWDTSLERGWGREGLRLLRNYVRLEDPRTVRRPNPLRREMWVRANLSADPADGVTAKSCSSRKYNECTPTFHVRGIVDRLDMIPSIVDHNNNNNNNNEQVALRIVDYKTGKAPNFKYSPAMNERIADEAFFQLKIYALLMREQQQQQHNTTTTTPNMNVRMLRLLHLTSDNESGQYLDMDLGETQQERDVVLQQVHVELSNVWKQICELVSKQDPKAFVGCQRSFCYCHKCRAQFKPGTVWEPP